jgi:transposase
MLKQTKDSPDRSLALDFGGQGSPADLGSFRDAVYFHEEDSAISWHLNWQMENELRIADPSSKRTDYLFQGKDIEVSSSVRLRNKIAAGESLEYNFSGTKFALKRARDKPAFQLDTQGSTDFRFIRTLGRKWDLPGPTKSYAFPDQARLYFQNSQFLSEFETAYVKQMDTRTRPERNTFPDHLPRERVVIAPPTVCGCCGGNRLRKLGEDVTRTLESVPRQWKVIETVREKFTCRDCEKISQAPAPFHVIARGWAGPSLLAMILYEKFGQHQPLNRQTERYALEGVPISLSTIADAVGACCTVLEPLSRLLEAHVMAAERLHGDDTTVPVLALGKCDVARCWVYVKDDRPFGGSDPPAAMFYYSRDRSGEHPQAHLANYTGILQADAFGGYIKLYEPQRSPALIREAACWVHARRPFFAMADLEENARRKAAGKKEIVISPVAMEIVRRIDALFEIERSINGQNADQRKVVRQAQSAPLVADLEA